MSFVVAPGATSISVDVFFADDTGAAVTGQVAANFPTCKWSNGDNTADTTITLSDLAAITTAHPNNNTAGGVKEREGGWYRLDLPNNMFTAAARKTLTFAESSGKRIIAPQIDCQYVQTNLIQASGTAVTLDSNNVLNVSTKYIGGALQTAGDVVNSASTAVTQTTAAAIASAILTAISEGSETVVQTLRLIRSSVVGKLSGAATTTVTTRDIADSKNRITATVDSNGNRTAVTTDGT